MHFKYKVNLKRKLLHNIKTKIILLGMFTFSL